MGWRPLISKVNLRRKILAVRVAPCRKWQKKGQGRQKIGHFLLKLHRWYQKKFATLKGSSSSCRDGVSMQWLEIFNKFGLNWRVLTAGAVGPDPRMSSCLVLLLRKFSSPRWPKFMQYNSTDSRYVAYILRDNQVQHVLNYITSQNVHSGKMGLFWNFSLLDIWPGVK